jgi:hypothetical protein
MSVTFEVSKDFKFIEVKDKQLKNKSFILTTKEVSKLLKSKDIKELQS